MGCAAMLPTFNKITISIIFVGSLFLLIGVLRSREGLKTREQRLTALTALLGLFYVGLELYWFVYVGSFPFRGFAIFYHFARHLLGGIVLGLLFYLGSPKSTKTILLISGLAFVALNLFIIAHYGLRHLGSAIRFLSLVNGGLIGVSITSAVLLWLDLDQGKANNQSNAGATIPGTTAGSRRDA